MDTPGAVRALAARFGDHPGSVIVGLGAHRPMTDAELAPLRAVSTWPVLNHDPDACTSLGEVDGVPCLVHPAIAEADAVLAVGKVELHQYAGFSGGHKAVSIGCGGRETLAAMHARDMVCHPDVVVGRLAGNPFRDRVDALGRACGLGFALQALPDGRWVGGDPEDALRVAAAALDPWRWVDRAYDTCVLRVPRAKAVNAYQASRAPTYLALSPAPPLVDGARLIVDAACPEGVGLGSGERALAEVLRRFAPPWAEVLTGPPPRGAGVQRVFIFARLAQRYRMIFAGCDDPAPLRAVGLDATATPADALAGPDALVVEAPFERLPQLRG